MRICLLRIRFMLSPSGGGGGFLGEENDWVFH